MLCTTSKTVRGGDRGGGGRGSRRRRTITPKDAGVNLYIIQERKLATGFPIYSPEMNNLPRRTAAAATTPSTERTVWRSGNIKFARLVN